MNEIYSEKDRRKAAADRRNSLLLYIATAVLLITVCVLFVILYIHFKKLLWLCVIVDFALGVLFFWFTVLFFYAVFPAKRERVRLFKIIENADCKYLRGVYNGTCENKTINSVEYIGCEFDIDGERKSLYVLFDSNSVFEIGMTYDLKVMGERIIAYENLANAASVTADVDGDDNVSGDEL